MSNSENHGYIRTLDDVEKIIDNAKLDRNSLNPVIQAIYFAENLEEHKLIELNKNIVDRLKVGDRIEFRGEMNNKAVLCTKSDTYEVREAETSNSLLLIPDLEVSKTSSTDKTICVKEVVGVYHNYYELKSFKPQLKILYDILEPYNFGGMEYEMIIYTKIYSFEELLESVQCSEDELRFMLKTMNAVEIKGKWRVLNFSYRYRIMIIFLNWIEENSWSFEEIRQKLTIEKLKELIPLTILEHLLSKYTDFSPGTTTSSDDILLKLNKYRVCRFFGELLLRATDKFDLAIFMKEWRKSVPTGLEIDASQLIGLGFSEDGFMYYCPENELPYKPTERFAALFKIKEKWTLEQIKPYVETVTKDEADMNALLTKFTRISNENGVTVFSAKYGK